MPLIDSAMWGAIARWRVGDRAGGLFADPSYRATEPLEARGAAPPPDLQPRQGECLSLHPTQGTIRWNEGALRIGGVAKGLWWGRVHSRAIALLLEVNLEAIGNFGERSWFFL